MGSSSDRHIDELILSFARARWLKVARIIAQVVDESRLRGIDADEYVVAARIRALVEDGRLEAEGNLLMWRLSEVRLIDSNRRLPLRVQ
jgi:hypothetical protein